MDIWQMKYFIQIYQDKNFSKASRNLYISQQALSKTIKKIETELQLPLFHRMPNGLKPTIYADTLYEKSCKIVNDYNSMLETLDDQFKNTNKTLIIGIAGILYSEELKIIISNFQQEYPNITLEFLEYGYYTCEKYLDDGLVDLCFSVKPDNIIKYRFISIFHYKMKLFVNKKNPLSKKSVINFIDLKNERFIMSPRDSKIRSIIIDSCLKAGYRPNIAITASQIDFITELISLNTGIAILPECNVKYINRHNNLMALSFHDVDFQIEVGFIVNKNQLPNYNINSFLHYYSNHTNV